MPRNKQTWQQTSDREQLLQQALDGIKSKVYKSVYDAAKQLRLSAITLQWRYDGAEGCVVAREDQQLLSQAENWALAK